MSRLPAGITRTPTGRFQARPTAGARRPRVFDTLSEAREYLRKEALRGQSVRQAISVWLESRPQIVKASTVERDRSITRRLPDWFTRLELIDVTPAHVQKVVAEYGGSTGTRKRVRTTLQAFFTAQVRSGTVPAPSPARDIKVVATDTGKPSRPFTWAEVDVLADKIGRTHPDYADAVVFSAHTGLRAGELIALRVRDVYQFPDPHIVVSRAWSNEARREESPKSGRTRLVPLDGYALDVIKRRMSGKSVDDLLFTSPNGARLSIRNLRRSVKWEAVAPGHTWKDLRHTAAVEWVQRSDVLSTADVQRLLGHATLDTTERYLSGLSGSVRQAHISAVFRGISPVSPPGYRQGHGQQAQGGAGA